MGFLLRVFACLFGLALSLFLIGLGIVAWMSGSNSFAVGTRFWEGVMLKWIILMVGAVISFLGVPAGLIGNELSIRYGLRTIATLVFVLSAVAGGLFGFTAMLPYIPCWAFP